MEKIVLIILFCFVFNVLASDYQNCTEGKISVTKDVGVNVNKSSINSIYRKLGCI